MKEKQMITFEQYKKLKPLESYFWTIKFGAYKRASSTRENELVKEILEEVTGKKQTWSFSCPQCVYNMFQQLAEPYFAAKDAYEAQEGMQEPQDSVNTKAEGNASTPKLRGRRKAKNNN